MAVFEYLRINFISFFLMAADEKISGGAYSVTKSLTPIGWALVIIFPAALIFGTIYLIVKILKKPKLK